MDRQLTLKFVFLLALASGKRRGELHALRNKVETVEGNENQILLVPDLTFMGKTHLVTNGLGTFENICLTALEQAPDSGDGDDCLLCPVRTLRYYQKRSDAYRDVEQVRLIISHQRQKKSDISVATVSSYIKQDIVEALLAQAKDAASMK